MCMTCTVYNACEHVCVCLSRQLCNLDTCIFTNTMMRIKPGMGLMTVKVGNSATTNQIHGAEEKREKGNGVIHGAVGNMVVH